MVTGAAAYTRLQKPDNSISQSLQNLGGLAAQQSAELRARAERDEVRQKQEQKEWEDKYGYKYDDFQAKVTGFNTYDQIKMDYASRIADKYVDLNRKALEAKSRGDTKTMKELENQMLRLKGTFKQINEADAQLGKINEYYTKLAQEGKVSGVDADNWEAQMQAILNHKYSLEVDENGNPMIHGIQTNPDGTTKDFVIPFSQVVDGTWRPYTKQQVAGKNGIIDNILNTLGKRKGYDRNGNVIITSQVWDEQAKNGAEQQIDILLGNPEIMADLYNQLTNGKSKKRTDFEPDEINEVKTALLKMVEAGYDTEESIKIDTQEARLAQSKKQHEEMMGYRWASLDEKKRDKINNGEIVYVGQNVTGYNASTQKASPERTFDEYGTNIPYKKGGTITGIRVNQNGKIILIGERLKGSELTKAEDGSLRENVYEIFEIDDPKEVYGLLAQKLKTNSKQEIDNRLKQLKTGQPDNTTDENDDPLGIFEN